MSSETFSSDAKAIDKFQELMKDIRFAMITTVAADGTLRARPMSTLNAPFDGDLWFFTADDASKVDEVMEERHVGVTYAEPEKQKYVSVSGRASIVRDKARAKELWSPAAKAWFPGGVDDPHLALLRVRIESVEYWDSPSSKMVQLYGLAKAIFTGERPKNLGENKKLGFPPRSESM
jgi:general stress protein 26